MRRLNRIVPSDAALPEGLTATSWHQEVRRAAEAWNAAIPGGCELRLAIEPLTHAWLAAEDGTNLLVIRGGSFCHNEGCGREGTFPMRAMGMTTLYPEGARLGECAKRTWGFTEDSSTAFRKHEPTRGRVMRGVEHPVVEDLLPLCAVHEQSGGRDGQTTASVAGEAPREGLPAMTSWALGLGLLVISMTGAAGLLCWRVAVRRSARPRLGLQQAEGLIQALNPLAPAPSSPSTPLVLVAPAGRDALRR